MVSRAIEIGTVTYDWSKAWSQLPLSLCIMGYSIVLIPSAHICDQYRLDFHSAVLVDQASHLRHAQNR